jgi:hypothetical protein
MFCDCCLRCQTGQVQQIVREQRHIIKKTLLLSLRNEPPAIRRAAGHPLLQNFSACSEQGTGKSERKLIPFFRATTRMRTAAAEAYSCRPSHSRCAGLGCEPFPSQAFEVADAANLDAQRLFYRYYADQGSTSRHPIIAVQKHLLCLCFFIHL